MGNAPYKNSGNRLLERPFQRFPFLRLFTHPPPPNAARVLCLRIYSSLHQSIPTAGLRAHPTGREEVPGPADRLAGRGSAAEHRPFGREGRYHVVGYVGIDEDGRRHRYRPDFLVEYADGHLAVIEVKGADKMDSPSVLRKRSAAEEWCRRRGMEYELTTRF